MFPVRQSWTPAARGEQTSGDTFTAVNKLSSPALLEELHCTGRENARLVGLARATRGVRRHAHGLPPRAMPTVVEALGSSRRGRRSTGSGRRKRGVNQLGKGIAEPLRRGAGRTARQRQLADVRRDPCGRRPRDAVWNIYLEDMSTARCAVCRHTITRCWTDWADAPSARLSSAAYCGRSRTPYDTPHLPRR